MAGRGNADSTRQPEPIAKAIDAFSELHVRSGEVLRAWAAWQGSVANSPSGERPDADDVRWGLAEGVKDSREFEARKAERRAKTPRMWQAWARHYDAHDDLVFAVCRWRESLDLVRELLPSIEEWVDDKREPAAKRWTAQVRRLLGKFGGHFNRYTIGEVPDTLDTADFGECATKVYKRMRYVMSVPPESSKQRQEAEDPASSSRSSPVSRESLRVAVDRFYQTLDAATVSAEDGGRRVAGVAHAVALSEATAVLHNELGAAHLRLIQQHGTVVQRPPSGFELMESDSPDGPWTPVPASDVCVLSMDIGGAGADAVLLAALESAVKATAFPVEKWNAMQAVRPGAKHQRFHVGEVLPASMLAHVESAVKLLGLPVAAASRPVGVDGSEGNPSESVTDEGAMLAPRDLAVILNVDQRALEKRLERWRSKHVASSDFVEVSNRSVREPQFLYRLMVGRRVAKGMKPSHDVSHKRRMGRKE